MYHGDFSSHGGGRAGARSVERPRIAARRPVGALIAREAEIAAQDRSGEASLSETRPLARECGSECLDAEK
jgi:hypothetical protein